MKSFFLRHKRILAEIGITILALLCVAALWRSIDSFKIENRNGELRPQSALTRGQPPTSSIAIGSWMTFNYLNVVFKLPPDYLRQQLAITDNRYPNVSIDAYSRRNHLDSQAVLLSIQKAIDSYQPAGH